MGPGTGEHPLPPPCLATLEGSDGAGVARGKSVPPLCHRLSRLIASRLVRGAPFSPLFSGFFSRNKNLQKEFSATENVARVGPQKKERSDPSKGGRERGGVHVNSILKCACHLLVKPHSLGGCPVTFIGSSPRLVFDTCCDASRRCARRKRAKKKEEERINK